MSGFRTGTPPRTDAELIRDMERRISQLEQRGSARVGGWTLSDRGDKLLATHHDGRTVVLSDVFTPDDPRTRFTLLHIGSWVLRVDATGQLVAVINADDGTEHTVVVAEPPEETP